VGFVVDKVALGQVLSEYFGFPCQFSFQRLLHTRHVPSGAGTIGQLVADVPSGLSLTSPQETKKNYNVTLNSQMYVSATLLEKDEIRVALNGIMSEQNFVKTSQLIKNGKVAHADGRLK
jgi:hypothetical protein